jgi:hypothetical protein
MAFPAVGDAGTNTVAPPNDWASKLLATLAVSMATDGTLVSSFIKLGTNPASAGAVRLANAGWIAGRNAANNADVNMIRVTAVNQVEIGANLILGASPSLNDPILFAQKNYTGLQSGNQSTAYFYAQAKGSRDTGHMLYNVFSQIQDTGVLATRTVTGAINNGSGLIRLTVTAHGYSTGDRVIVEQVGGVPNATGSWVVTNIGANTIDLQGSTFAGSYTSGGITTNRPGYHGYLASVAPSVSRGGLTGVNAHADDVSCFFGSNTGTAKATDFIYQGHTPGIGTEWDTCGSFDGASTFGWLINNIVGTGASIRATTYGATAAPEYQLRNSRGTFDAPLRTKNADLLARFSGVPSIAVDDVTASTFSGVTARIDMYANEDQTAAAQGSRMVFYTTPIGSSTINEKFRIANTDGIDFFSGTFTNYQLRFKNNVVVQGMNNAGSTGINLFKTNTSDSLEFLTGFTITDAKDVILATGTGTKFGTAITQKMGFYGVTPIAQRAGAAQVAVATTASTNTTPFGYTTAAQADAIVTLVNELRAWAVSQGFIKGAA